ncbi:hypothetical protein Tsubulata_034105 [Turnera subulata]|uniref:Bromo domain-containing protein n=1 Tax=Turnera subulata TaxID=218843 RepID=A0A9Q0G3Q6_9ROSI|nr:hypothetical protein Tsubulata_034105 [Turnera subulata]
MGAEVEEGRWGTWEELLLVGAVLRHGTRDWDLVAAELRARTVCPFTFTPEVCKAKYEDLQQRYSGCTALFDELRKQRTAELRRALEVSADTIGSLESKLETLKAERGEDCRVSNESSQTESLVPCQKSDGVESSSKEISKDGLSAGSFTHETRITWSPEYQIPASVPAEEIETKQGLLVSPEEKKVSSMWNLIAIGQGACIRRRRGKRKRKDCIKDIKEGSMGESEFSGSADVASATQCKDNSTSFSGQGTKCLGPVNQCKSSIEDEMPDLVGIFDSIAENKCASVFRRRLDSQKRGRYKKMILQHMDLDTIRSRISTGSITSAKEVFRDLLLLANNALVFYSRTTREYKSALLLREIVTKSLRQHLKDYISKTTITLLMSMPSLINPPVKPRTPRADNRKMSGKVAKGGNTVSKTQTAGKRPSNPQPPPSEEPSTIRKRGSGRPKKPGRRSNAQGIQSPPKRKENATTGKKRIQAK